MGLRLNDITDEILLENLPFDERLANDLESELRTISRADVARRLHVWSAYGEQLVYLASSLYQLERPPEFTLDKFARAAASFAQFLAIPGAMRERAWKLVEYLSWSIAFSTPEVRERLGHLEAYELGDPD